MSVRCSSGAGAPDFSSLSAKDADVERRTEIGTLELLLTVPVSNSELALGKFTACMGLIWAGFNSGHTSYGCAIGRTVGLGPVIGGNVAAFFLATSYTAIGLTISARIAGISSHHRIRREHYVPSDKMLWLSSCYLCES